MSEIGKCMKENWGHQPRWLNVKRPYSGDDVLRLRGSVKIAHTIAEMGAHQLWALLNSEEITEIPTIDTAYYIHRDFKALYLERASLALQVNKTLRRADEANFGENKINYIVPVIIGLGGEFSQVVTIYEITRELIEAGVSGIRLCHKHVPPNTLIKMIVAVRLAADVCSVPLVIFVDTVDPDQAEACALYCDQIIPQENKIRFLDVNRTCSEHIYARRYAEEVGKVITQHLRKDRSAS